VSVGSRVFREISRPHTSVISRLALFDTADLSDVMRHCSTMIGITAITDCSTRIAGPAVTASLPLGGVNLMKLAVDAATTGDVLVLAARGASHYAVFGGYISLAMRNRGLAGVVVDGAVRDRDEIQSAGLPVFARGVATAACVPEAVGEINVPVACGGVVVRPGDIVIGDRNGLVVVNPADAAEILAKLEDLVARHNSWGGDIAQGNVPGIEETVARAHELRVEFIAGEYGGR